MPRLYLAVAAVFFVTVAHGQNATTTSLVGNVGCDWKNHCRISCLGCEPEFGRHLFGSYEREREQ